MVKPNPKKPSKRPAAGSRPTSRSSTSRAAPSRPAANPSSGKSPGRPRRGGGSSFSPKVKKKTRKQPCPTCGAPMEWETRPFTEEFKGRTKTVSVLAWWCDEENCREAIFDGKAIQILQAARDDLEKQAKADEGQKSRKASRASAVPAAAKASSAKTPPVALATQPRVETGLARRGRSSGRRSTLLSAFFAKRSDSSVRNYRADLVHFGLWRLWDPDRETCAFSDVKAPALLTNDDKDAFVSETLQDFYKLDGLEALASALEYVDDLRVGATGFKYAGQTINHRIAALRAVTDLAGVFGLCSFDLKGLDTLVTTRSRSTDGCGPEGYQKLLEESKRAIASARTPQQLFQAHRNNVILILLHDSGLRRFEGLGIRLPEGVDLERGRILFRGKKRVDKEWFEALSDDGIEAIRNYVAIRGEAPGYLLYGRDPEHPLHESTVNTIIGKIASDAGVKVTPHGLRHTSATTLLNETNGNVRAVAAFLRHKTTAQVQIYDDERQRLPKQMAGILSKARRSKS